jgi:hypothetical protein
LSEWKERCEQWGWAGVKSQPRNPRCVAHRYGQRTRHLMPQARQRLITAKGLIGSRAIQIELRQSRLLRRVPSLATIKRVLYEGRLIEAV